MAFGDVTRSEAEKTFNEFLIEMYDRLQKFISIGASLGFVFEYRMCECRDIELFFDDYIDSFSQNNIEDVISFFSRYLGEMFIHNYGGRWFLYKGDDIDLDNNMPVIMGSLDTVDIPFSPRRTMYAYYLRRKEGLIEKIINSHVQAINIVLKRQQETRK